MRWLLRYNEAQRIANRAVRNAGGSRRIGRGKFSAKKAVRKMGKKK